MIKKAITSLLILTMMSNFFFSFSKQTKSLEQPEVIINEMMWMGSSLSSYDEWIELKNMTESEIDLAGWYLTKKSSGVEKLMLVIPEGKLISDFFVIANYSHESENCILLDEPELIDSDVSLSNSQLQIKLYDAAGNLIDAADDGSGQPLAGEYTSGSVWQSMERNNKYGEGTLATSWHTAVRAEGFKSGVKELGSPGRENSNSVPQAEAGDDQEVLIGEKVYFDASDSFDPDGDDLTYAWDFGDGAKGLGVTPTHAYQKKGDYRVILRVSDGLNDVSDGLIVSVKEHEEIVFEPSPGQEEGDNDGDESEEKTEYEYSDKVLFNEFFPNPEGTDKDFEFIELVNLGPKNINLIGWQIKSGEKAYAIKAGVIIKAKGFLVLKYAQTKMYLINSGQNFQLLDPKRRIIDEAEYGDSKEGQSFSRMPGTSDWAWSSAVTEGKENIIEIDVAEKDEGLEENTNNEEPENERLEVSLTEAKDLEKGEEVTVSGFVSVEPGILGAQYFYLFDGEAGIKIYSSKKLFPDLSIGDFVKVTGKISESGGEKKINISAAGEIEIINNSGNFPEAIAAASNELSDGLVGSLLLISGEILDSISTKIIVGDDTGEIEVFLKKATGIKGSEYEEGSKVEILGILVPYKEGYRLLPRAESDIRVIEQAATEGTNNQKTKNAGEVLGAQNINETVIPPAVKNPMIRYLVMILIGLVLVTFGLIIRWRQKRKILAES